MKYPCAGVWNWTSICNTVRIYLEILWPRYLLLCLPFCFSCNHLNMTQRPRYARNIFVNSAIFARTQIHAMEATAHITSVVSVCFKCGNCEGSIWWQYKWLVCWGQEKTHTCSYMVCPFECCLILSLLKESESQQGTVRHGTVCWWLNWGCATIYS